MPDLNSLPPSSVSPGTSLPTRHNNNPDIHPRPTGSPSPRSSSVSLAAAATINAGIQNQDSRHSSTTSSRSRPSPQVGRSERRRSNVAMNLNLNDPTIPGPGELQSSDRRSSFNHPFHTSSPHGIGSPITAHHQRTPSLGEIHQELEQEQEAQVVRYSIGVLDDRAIEANVYDRQNRLLEMIRQQQAQLQQIQQQAGFTPSTSTGAVDDSTPTSERSFSFPNIPGNLPMTVSNPRPRSPVARSSMELSRQSSRRSRTPSHAGSPALRPLSAGLQAHADDWLLSGGNQGSRDESAFYQAETQMLTRENQMLRLRIRELGKILISVS